VTSKDSRAAEGLKKSEGKAGFLLMLHSSTWRDKVIEGQGRTCKLVTMNKVLLMAGMEV